MHRTPIEAVLHARRQWDLEVTVGDGRPVMDPAARPEIEFRRQLVQGDRRTELTHGLIVQNTDFVETQFVFQQGVDRRLQAPAQFDEHGDIGRCIGN